MDTDKVHSVFIPANWIGRSFFKVDKTICQIFQGHSGVLLGIISVLGQGAFSGTRNEGTIALAGSLDVCVIRCQTKRPKMLLERPLPDAMDFRAGIRVIDSS